MTDAWRGFIRTWLSPNYAGLTNRHIVVVFLLVVACMGALVARSRPSDSHAVIFFALTGIALAAILNFLPAGLVPGLVFAFPVLFAGLVVLRRDGLREMTPIFFLVVATIFFVAVIFTQYGVGGSVEWGGRYFAIGVPLVCPVAVVTLRRVGRQLDDAPRTWALVGVTAISLALASLRSARPGTFIAATD